MAEFEKIGAVPSSLTAGDTVEFELGDLSVGFPASTFTLSMAARRNGGTGTGDDSIAVAFTADGDVHVGTLATAGKTAGDWSWSIKATNAGVTQTVARGTLVLLPDPSTSDARSHAERMLAAIESLLEGRATKDVASYAIAGRSLTRMTVDELMKWRSQYRTEVAKERARGKPNGGRRITLARFS